MKQASPGSERERLLAAENERLKAELAAALGTQRAQQTPQSITPHTRNLPEVPVHERDLFWQVSHDMLGIADDQGIWLSINPAWSTIMG
ncbi:MAG: hypothetical protein CPDRYMAC_2264 [uncultured Paraburkholderia sp.]|nr:MAG: hypothetical protein CPDRYDRY_2234 [uncultured Paraburkholderia sp.]CAH2923567.1 MAG: hypothetical protein CPDRYMAC_2264 [uncultured Paraburkholderia sp.]